jgi:hypothetical protein
LFNLRQLLCCTSAVGLRAFVSSALFWLRETALQHQIIWASYIYKNPRRPYQVSAASHAWYFENGLDRNRYFSVRNIDGLSLLSAVKREKPDDPFSARSKHTLKHDTVYYRFNGKRQPTHVQVVLALKHCFAFSGSWATGHILINAAFSELFPHSFTFWTIQIRR